MNTVRYDKAYMQRNNYCVRSPEEARIKAAQARLIARVLEPRRVLVAGCAAGELMISLLAAGVDTWGFDLADDLESFVYPEVRDRVLRFDVADLESFPFERAGGGFDTFVAIDLFEHVEEENVDRMLDGVAESFEKLAVVISSSPVFEGHICVKPFSWWLARLKARGFELLSEPQRLEPQEEGVYGIKRFDRVLEDMSEQIVFLRRKSTKKAPIRPKVSIGVVCCDRPDYLRITLESTRASLRQFEGQVEWLAFDNGSSPAVLEVLAEARIGTVIRAPVNVGLAPALDELYHASRGEYVLALEDDWKCLADSPRWFELATRILDENRDVGVVRLRRIDDGQCGHAARHRYDVALRHHPWSIKPLPKVVETRELRGERFYVAPSEYVNWTNNPVLSRRQVREDIGAFAAYLPDPKDHRPREGHPGLEGAIDARWRRGHWKVAKLLDGPFTHIGDQPAGVGRL